MVLIKKKKKRTVYGVIKIPNGILVIYCLINYATVRQTIHKCVLLIEKRGSDSIIIYRRHLVRAIPTNIYTFFVQFISITCAGAKKCRISLYTRISNAKGYDPFQ